MILKKLALQNFLSYEFVEIDLSDQGLVLISGKTDSSFSDSNGAGKSALLVDSIPWALFGQTIREKMFGSTARGFNKDAVVNYTVNKDCCVWLAFSVGDEDYEISRYRKDTQNGNHVFLANSTDKNQNPQDLTGETDEETNQKIIRLIGMNYQGFCNSVIYGQGAAKRFTQCTNSERRKIFEEFLQLGVFEQARKSVMSELSIAIDDVRKLDHSVDTYERLLKDRKFDRGESIESLKEAKRLRTSMKENTKIQVKQLKTDRKEWESGITRIKSDTKLLKEKLKDVVTPSEAKVSRVEKELDVAKEILTNNSYDLRGYTKDLAVIKKHSVEFQSGDICPTCDRKMLVKDVEAFHKNLTTEKTRLEQLTKSCRKLETKYNKNLREKKQIVQDLKTFVSECADIRRQLLINDSVLLRHEKKLVEITAKESTISHKTNTYSEQIEQFERLISQADKHIYRNSRALSAFQMERDHEKSVSEDLEFVAYAFSNKGIKDFIFRQSLKFVNDHLAILSQRISDGEINVSLTNSLDVGVDIKQAAQTYQGASGGQGKRIDLCIALALQALVESGWQGTNLMIIDEFDAALDKTGIDRFLSLLKEEAARKGSVFVISHNSYLSDQFDKEIVVEYVEGVSTV